MTKYLKKVKELLKGFLLYKVRQMAREENKTANSLSKFLSSKLNECIIQEIQMTSCLEKAVVAKIDIKDLPGQVEKMIQYLKKSELLENAVVTNRIKRQVVKYLILDGVLYRCGRTHPFLRYLTLGEAKKMLVNFHARHYGSYIGGIHKVLR